MSWTDEDVEVAKAAYDEAEQKRCAEAVSRGWMHADAVRVSDRRSIRALLDAMSARLAMRTAPALPGLYPLPDKLIKSLLRDVGWREGKDGYWRRDEYGGAFKMENALLRSRAELENCHAVGDIQQDPGLRAALSEARMLLETATQDGHVGAGWLEDAERWQDGWRPELEGDLDAKPRVSQDPGLLAAVREACDLLETVEDGEDTGAEWMDGVGSWLRAYRPVVMGEPNPMAQVDDVTAAKDAHDAAVRRLYPHVVSQPYALADQVVMGSVVTALRRRWVAEKPEHVPGGVLAHMQEIALGAQRSHQAALDVVQKTEELSEMRKAALEVTQEACERAEKERDNWRANAGDAKAMHAELVELLDKERAEHREVQAQLHVAERALDDMRPGLAEMTKLYEEERQSREGLLELLQRARDTLFKYRELTATGSPAWKHEHQVLGEVDAVLRSWRVAGAELDLPPRLTQEEAANVYLYAVDETYRERIKTEYGGLEMEQRKHGGRGLTKLIEIAGPYLQGDEEVDLSEEPGTSDGAGEEDEYARRGVEFKSGEALKTSAAALDAVARDATAFGTGYLVDGKRVDPTTVRVFTHRRGDRPPLDDAVPATAMELPDPDEPELMSPSFGDWSQRPETMKGKLGPPGRFEPVVPDRPAATVTRLHPDEPVPGDETEELFPDKPGLWRRLKNWLAD